MATHSAFLPQALRRLLSSSGELNLEQKKGKTRGAGGGEEHPASGQRPRDKQPDSRSTEAPEGGSGTGLPALKRDVSSVWVSNKEQAVSTDTPQALREVN